MDKQLAKMGVTPGRRVIRIALAGNPNSGKTTLFNALTGTHQHVGNYPGVTVEKKDGFYEYGDCQVQVTDLPGTYSLTAGSPEELVARDVILNESPDVVVDIVDASNLERNLYLAMQIRELGVPMILVLNMADVAESRGHHIDLEKLSALLGMRIIRTVASRGQGVNDLKQAVLAVATAAMPAMPAMPAMRIYGKDIESELDALIELISQGQLAGNVPARRRWLAVKLLEHDEVVEQYVDRGASHAEAILTQAVTARANLEKEFGDDVEMVMADKRYGAIATICSQAVRSGIAGAQTRSDRIDRIMTHRLLGIPIFLAMMFLVFKLTFAVGDPLMGMIEGIFGFLGNQITSIWPEAAMPLLESLLVDGIIGGVGGVLVFLPNILLLFLAIAILEDSGYMARAAFIMDRIMNKIGLHGKSFIPLLIGFGCTVPAIMATRTLENERDRLTTMLVAPLMSCGARLPIYAMIIPAFFPAAWHAWMLWFMYMIGIVLAVLCARLLRSTLFKGDPAPFVMELPPYRLPTLRGVLFHMWERGWLYVKKAGTVILGVSVVMWALTTFPEKTDFTEDYDGQIAALTSEQPTAGDDATAVTISTRIDDLEHARQAELLTYTFAGRIGHGMAPILRPLGFDWRIGTALIICSATTSRFVS